MTRLVCWPSWPSKKKKKRKKKKNSTLADYGIIGYESQEKGRITVYLKGLVSSRASCRVVGYV